MGRIEGPLSAKSGRSLRPENDMLTSNTRPKADMEVAAAEHCLVRERMTPIQFLRPYDGWLMWSRCLPGPSIKLLFLNFVRMTKSVAIVH